MSTPTPAAPIETIYESLALAIDRAGPDNEALFLAKLALALGAKLDSPAAFQACLEMALADLPRPVGVPSISGAITGP